MKYWQPKYETMPRSEIEALQLKRLKNVVKNVYEYVPFYRQAFGSIGIKPGDIRSLEDISRLPGTSKADLRD
ncbi:MAG: phenylacetate--CoA ligase, partial [Methanosarcinales archaeon]|nr:phenylacetate--CoA ligase [Methanosarcinales archaeon]